jgi:hypothetical protein
MEIIAKNVTLINIKAQPFDFIGKKGDQVKGISYRATILGGDGGVFVMKTDESVYKDAGECKNQEGDAEIGVSFKKDKEGKETNEINFVLKKFNWTA